MGKWAAFCAGLRDFASAGRDIFALLFPPICTAMGCWLICILAYGAWTADTQPLRIHYLGALALAALGLVALGGLWLQRKTLGRLKISGPGGIGGEFESDDDAPPAVARVTTTTTLEAPPNGGPPASP